MSSIQNIVNWNKSRNLFYYDPVTEYNILASEFNEYTSSLIAGNDPVDDLADIIVVALGTLHKLGYDPDAVITEVYKEIDSREGVINTETGKWEKDRSQNPSTLYTADYSTCRAK